VNTKKLLSAALLLALALCALGFRQSRPAWEYKQICTVKEPKKLDNDAAAIQQAGAEGWEMVGANTLFESVSCVHFKRQK
jgi:hypothetical protein